MEVYLNFTKYVVKYYMWNPQKRTNLRQKYKISLDRKLLGEVNYYEILPDTMD